MHNFVPRFLKSLLVLVVISLLTSSFAWSLLGLVTVEDDSLTIESELLDSTADLLGIDDVGDALYTVQEDVVHGTLRSAGVKVPHSYYDLCLGDNCIPVDPFEFNR